MPLMAADAAIAASPPCHYSLLILFRFHFHDIFAIISAYADFERHYFTLPLPLFSAVHAIAASHFDYSAFT
jgi:hypothetical protein